MGLSSEAGSVEICKKKSKAQIQQKDGNGRKENNSPLGNRCFQTSVSSALTLHHDQP
jgi:hypothetical protein